MNIFDYLKDKVHADRAGVLFEDYVRQVSDPFFIKSLEYSFNQIDGTDNATRQLFLSRGGQGIKSLTKEEFANLKSVNGFSLLQVACSRQNADAVEMLVKNGADVNYRNQYGLTHNYTPLYYALGLDNVFISLPTQEANDKKYAEEAFKDKRNMNFDSFKRIVNVLLEHNAYALDNEDVNITNFNNHLTTKSNLKRFTRDVLQGRCEFYTTQTDENNQTIKTPVPMVEAIKYLTSIPDIKKSLNGTDIVIAKQNDVDTFVYLMNGVDKGQRQELLRQIHIAEANSIVSISEDLINVERQIKSLGAELEKRGENPEGMPSSPLGYSYHKALIKRHDLEQQFEKTVVAHNIVTSEDNEYTFDVPPMHYYTYRFVNGRVVDLLDTEMSALNYFIKTGENVKESVQIYKQEMAKAYPEVAKEKYNSLLDDFTIPFTENCLRLQQIGENMKEAEKTQKDGEKLFSVYETNDIFNDEEPEEEKEPLSEFEISYILNKKLEKYDMEKEENANNASSEKENQTQKQENGSGKEM